MSESAHSSRNEALAEQRAKRFWVSLVVVLLTLQVGIGFVAIYLATGDRSVAIVPNYHQAALDWDQTKRAQTAADRLGWTISLAASDVADGRGLRALELQVRDGQGNPVSHLEIAASVYHHARGGDIQSIEFGSAGEGRYLVLAPMARSGLWQIDVTIRGAEEPMTLSRTLDVTTTGSP